MIVDQGLYLEYTSFLNHSDALQFGDILCQYKSSFLCPINELIHILFHMTMNVIYKMHH